MSVLSSQTLEAVLPHQTYRCGLTALGAPCRHLPGCGAGRCAAGRARLRPAEPRPGVAGRAGRPLPAGGRQSGRGARPRGAAGCSPEPPATGPRAAGRNPRPSPGNGAVTSARRPGPGAGGGMSVAAATAGTWPWRGSCWHTAPTPPPPTGTAAPACTRRRSAVTGSSASSCCRTALPCWLLVTLKDGGPATRPTPRCGICWRDEGTRRGRRGWRRREKEKQQSLNAASASLSPRLGGRGAATGGGTRMTAASPRRDGPRPRAEGLQSATAQLLWGGGGVGQIGAPPAARIASWGHLHF